MEKAPREFKLTVHFDGLIPRIFFNNFVQMSTFKSEEQLHVIEYAAYENLKSKLNIAVDALRFYADADNWNHIEAGTHYVTNVYPCVDKTDYGDGDFIISERMNVDDCGVGGKKARQAIKEIEGSIEKE